MKWLGLPRRCGLVPQSHETNLTVAMNEEGDGAEYNRRGSHQPNCMIAVGRVGDRMRRRVTINRQLVPTATLNATPGISHGRDVADGDKQYQIADVYKRHERYTSGEHDDCHNWRFRE